MWLENAVQCSAQLLVSMTLTRCHCAGENALPCITGSGINMHALELIVQNTRACAPLPRRASDIAARSLATHGYLPKSASDGLQTCSDPAGPGPLPASIAFTPSIHQYLTCGGLSSAPAGLRKVPSQMSLLRGQLSPVAAACECPAIPPLPRKAQHAGNECTNIAAAAVPGKPSYEGALHSAMRSSVDGATSPRDVHRSGPGSIGQHSAAAHRSRAPPPQFGTEGIPEGRSMDNCELGAAHTSPLNANVAGPAGDGRDAERTCPLHGAGIKAGAGAQARGGYVVEGTEGAMLARAQRAYLPAMRMFTFLRLTRELVEPRSQGHWLRFMSEMRQQAPLPAHKNLAMAS